MRTSHLRNLISGSLLFVLLSILLLGGCVFRASEGQGTQEKTTYEGIKIVVEQDGIVAIPIKQLKAYGFEEQTAAQWMLSFRGVEVPFWLIGQAPKLVFYVPPTKSPYWSKKVFILQRREGFHPDADPEVASLIDQLQLPSASFLERQPKQTVLSHFELEENQIYQSQAEGEHWYWKKILNGQEQSFIISFDDAPQGEVFIRVHLFSVTEAPSQPDHILRVDVNERFVEENYWDGKGNQQLEIIVPPEAFRKGENRLILSVPELEEVFAQLSYLDKIEIYAWQSLPFAGNSSKFYSRAPVTTDILADLDRSAWIWEINQPLAPRMLEKGEALAAGTEHKWYLWVREKSFQAPLELHPIQNSSRLELQPMSVDYLLIAEKELLEPLAPLIEFRRREGLSVLAVDAEDIYNQFDGFVEPQAIRSYIASVASQSPRLKYVLLVGDATYDPSGYVSSKQQNRLPTFLIDTIFGGQTASELPFAVFDESSLDFLDTQTVYSVSVAVGRLPASLPEQVRQWVTKVIQYEQGNQKPKEKGILAIADPQESSFSRDASSFLDRWDEMNHKELFLPEVGNPNLGEEIRNVFQQDYQMIAYFGHGAIDLWGKNEIFTVEDAQNLKAQPSYPLVLNFTCLTGYYIHPEVLSLSEALLWNPKGGTIFAIAPTSLTLADDQSFLWKALIASYQNQPNARIGEVWLSALRNITLTNDGVRDVVATYTLFGDPATTLP